MNSYNGYSIIYYIYFKLAEITNGNELENMGDVQAKSDQTAKSVAGYKWSQKVAVFGKLIEKGQTYRVTFLKFRFRPQVFGK